MTMNVILGNFSKDNYKKYSNKINHINIMLHTAIPHQKCYFLNL